MQQKNSFTVQKLLLEVAPMTLQLVLLFTVSKSIHICFPSLLAWGLPGPTKWDGQHAVGCGEGRMSPPQKKDIFLLKRHVLAHFERAGDCL